MLKTLLEKSHRAHNRETENQQQRPVPRPILAHSRLVIPSRLAATILGMLPVTSAPPLISQSEERRALLIHSQRGRYLHGRQGRIVDHCGNGIHPKQQSLWKAMNVRIDHRPEPVRQCHKSGNKNVHLAGTNQQDRPPRILRFSCIQQARRKRTAKTR